MITSIIFSKNRACQLDLLLQSIRKNLPQLEDIWILWDATTLDFRKGYNLLFQKHNDLGILNQIDFYEDTKFLIRMAKDYVCFFVDDNIIYRPTSLTKNFLDSIWNSIPEMTCFTLRLGKNTVIQDQYNNQSVVFPQEFLMGNIDNTNVLVWNWTTVQTFGNFGYPFSVDGHIYKTSDLLPLLDYKFENPNALEGRFNINSFKTKAMACFEQSVLVNNPLNLVGSSNNNAGKWYGHTLEELNQKYLDNQEIDLDSIMSQNIVGCHQEMPIQFKET
jgi:hypothetical protein